MNAVFYGMGFVNPVQMTALNQLLAQLQRQNVYCAAVYREYLENGNKFNIINST